MKIKWLGHSSFIISSQSGTKIFIDPYDERAGYHLTSEKADIVTTSHKHGDHNHLANAIGPFTHLSQPGKYKIKDIEISGVGSFHDEDKGDKRGENTIFIYNVDGLRICHCGDLGHTPSEDMLDEIGKVDVLMIPVGGVYTVDAKKAFEIVRVLNPSITIPMHFKTDIVKFPIESVDEFLELTQGVYLGVQEIDITKDNLKSFPKVSVLEYH